jgi:leucyl-tRNA synthetase
MKIIDFNKLEDKWQKKWDKEKAFEASVDKKKKKFFFTTPYPYISGSLHLGHGRAVTESDIYCRYLRMKGFNVLYPMAFHITGTPVLGIASAIKNGNKEKINLYEGYVSAYEKNKGEIRKIVRSFEDPQKIVDFFIPKMIDEYKKLGLSVDWRRSFTSGDMEHQQMVTWQFEKYNKMNFLKKGKYPVLYSPEDESAMGEDDIVDADVNGVEKQEFTLLKFKFGKKFLVAATLRPETVFGQTNLWVNPKVNYVEIKVGGEIWIVSEECIQKLKYQRKDIEFIGNSNEVLIGKTVRAPMIDREIPILPSNFVDSDVGTGIVTSVPSDAPYDYVALRELQTNNELTNKYGLDKLNIEKIKVIPIIKTKKYGNEAGVKVVEDSGVVLQGDKKLERLTQEVYKEGFHSGFLMDNCGKYSGMKVVVAKEKMKEELIKNGEADVMFETSRKAFSRGGGKIIVAVMDDQWFIDFNARGWKKKAENALKKVEIVPENYRKQFEDVFEWLDKRPCARRRGLGTKFPLGKNWIIESLSDSTIYMTLYTIQNIIRREKLKREGLTHEFFEYVYLGEGGLKSVAKSTGVSEKVLKELRESFDYWMPMDHRHTFFLHLANHLSFMLFAHAGIFPKSDWPKKISIHGLVVSGGVKMSKSKGNLITLLHVKEKYGADVFRFYMTNSSNIEGTFDWHEKDAENSKATIGKLYMQIEDAIKQKRKAKVRDLFVSRFNRIKKNASSKVGDMKLREYDNLVVFDMLALVKSAKAVMDKTELAGFYNMISEDWIKMISPVCPHIAEELWSKFGGKGFVSLANWVEFDEKKIDNKLEESERQVEKTVEDVKNILKLIGGGDKVYLYVIPSEFGSYDTKVLGKKLGKTVKVYAVNDKKKHDPEGKSKKVKPGRPGIFIE